MTDPLVSVKMITYNHASYIEQAIEGVLQQKTNFPFELVIGEDCSTDGTREIVFEVQKKHPDIIRVITSDKNVGMKKNSYRTTKSCRGRYIAICEGDDYWHCPDKLQVQVNYMESHRECGMVHSGYDVYDVRSKKAIRDYGKVQKFEIPQKPAISDIVDGLGVSFRIQTCTVMVRRTLCEQIIESDPYLHQSDHFLMGDTQLWAELSAISEVGYIPDSLATYRLIDESATQSRDPKKPWRFMKSASEMKLYLCDKHNLAENIRRRKELVWCDSSLRLAFYEKNVGLALEVKKRKQTFTLKEWLRYFGAKYFAFHYGYRAAVLLLNLFRRGQI